MIDDTTILYIFFIFNIDHHFIIHIITFFYMAEQNGVCTGESFSRRCPKKTASFMVKKCSNFTILLQNI